MRVIDDSDPDVQRIRRIRRQNRRATALASAVLILGAIPLLGVILVIPNAAEFVRRFVGLSGAAVLGALSVRTYRRYASSESPDVY